MAGRKRARWMTAVACFAFLVPLVQEVPPPALADSGPRYTGAPPKSQKVSSAHHMRGRAWNQQDRHPSRKQDVAAGRRANQPASSVSGLNVSVGYADSLRANPSLPVPWQGSANTQFIGTSSNYDAGAIRLDNTTTSAIAVNDVTVNVHGTSFDLWGSFTIAGGASAILTQTSAYNFDTSDIPSTCTSSSPPAPTIAITLAQTAPQTVADGAHVLDTGGIDMANCPSGSNESEAWRPIGTVGPPGNTTDTLTLSPATQSDAVGSQANVTAALVDPSGAPAANATVSFQVSAGPNVNKTGTAVTDSTGHATFSYTSANTGTDTVTASVSNASGGSLSSANSATVTWTSLSCVATTAPCALGEMIRSAPQEPRCNAGAYPVNCANGDFWHTFDDLAIPGRGRSLDFARAYNSLAASQDSPLGFGWTDSYNMFLTTDSSGAITVYEEGGSSYVFTPSSGRYQPQAGIMASLVKNADGTFTLTRNASQDKYTFSAPSVAGRGLLQKEVDRNGYATALTYSNGQLSSITDAAGRSLTLTYNASNRIAAFVDPANRQVSFGYDGASNLTDVTDVGGGHWHFTYDGHHLLLTMEDPNQFAAHGAISTGPVVTNVYDGGGRVTQQTDPMGRITRFGYTVNGDGTQTTTVTDPRGTVTSKVFLNNEVQQETEGVGTSQASTWKYTYDPATFGPTSATDPNNHVWSYAWDSRGNMLSETDPLNHVTTYAYDALNDLTSITDPSGVVTTMAYDANGNVLSSSRPLTSTGQKSTVSLTYGDTAHPGDVTQGTDANGHTASLEYDVNGDLTRVTDAAGDISTYGYDTVGRMTSSVRPKGNVAGASPAAYTTGYVYDAFGRPTTVTDPLQHQTVVTYDANGNTTSIKDARGNTTTYSYDADGEQTGVGRADGTSNGMAYDSNGNLAAQTDGLGNTTSYAYDPLDRLVSKADPLNRKTSYAYDAAGNQTSLIDAMNRTTTYGRDSADELTTITYSDGTTPNVSFGYDALGRRTSMTDGTGTSGYTYDSLGRLTQSKNGAGQTVGYGYDLGGNLTTLIYPDGSQVARAYDAADRVTTVTDWLQHSTGFSYDPNGNVTGQTYPNSTAVNFSYNAADQLTQILDSKANTSFWTFSYGRDPVGQVSTASDPIENQQHAYSYDSLNRMTGGATYSSYDNGQWAYNAADEVTQGPYTYSYDAAHELNTVNLSFAATCTSRYQEQQFNFTYNANGDRTSGNAVCAAGPPDFGYDRADRLISYGSTAQYKYDGDGLRASKSSGGSTTGETWNVAEGLPLMIQDGTTKYITGPDGLPVEQVDGSGNVLYYYQDQLGSTRGLLDGSGTTVATYTYDAYGNTVSYTGTATTPFQYAGQYTDSESGLQYLRARYYDPSTQQFLTVDPIADQTGQPYAYAGDNPVNGVDPSGLACAGLVPVPFTGDSWSSCKDRTGAAVSTAVSGFLNSAAAPVYSTASSADTSCYAAQAQAAGTGSEADAYVALAYSFVPVGGEAEAGEAGVTVMYARFWPASAIGMDNLLGVEGQHIPDGPTTLGRGKVVWRPSQHVKITGEQHPYHPEAPGFHRHWHWHLDTPGQSHQTFLPGDLMP